MRKKFIQHIVILNLLNMFIFMTMAILFEDATMNLHPNHGIFGWLDSEHAFSCIFLYGFFATFWGTVGYILSMQFYSPLTCMNAYLLEPILAQLWGWLAGYDLFPNFVTCLGVLAITGATVILNHGTNIMI